MRVLVTGGAGFLGGHLCDRLIEAGHEVSALDDLSTGQRANIAHLTKHPRFRFIEHDVTSPLPDIEFAQIYHLACPASPRHYQKDPIATIKTAFMGTLHVLENARMQKARVVVASTSEVYGQPEVHPQVESYVGHVNPTGPRACYNVGKRASETLATDFHRQYGVDARIARIFNTYGPRMQPGDGRVISTLIDQALRGAPLTLFGDGTQTRSFCYVTDTVDALMQLMAAPAVDGPVNLGSDIEVAVTALAKMIIDLTGNKSDIVFRPLPDDDPTRRRPDLGRAREVLGWHPQVSLEEGLKLTIASMSQ